MRGCGKPALFLFYGVILSNNIVKFPGKSPKSDISHPGVFDFDYVKWHVGDDCIQSICDQIMDFLELEVDVPVGGPLMDKFSADLKMFLAEQMKAQ